MTVSGVPFDEVMEYLSNLGLEQATRDSRLFELGRRIRYILIKLFCIASVTRDMENGTSARERN